MHNLGSNEQNLFFLNLNKLRSLKKLNNLSNLVSVLIFFHSEQLPSLTFFFTHLELTRD